MEEVPETWDFVAKLASILFLPAVYLRTEILSFILESDKSYRLCLPATRLYSSHKRASCEERLGVTMILPRNTK